jgi:hypothetical protein
LLSQKTAAQAAVFIAQLNKSFNRRLEERALQRFLWAIQPQSTEEFPMQASQVKQQLPQIQQQISDAQRICQSSQSAPQELKKALNALSNSSNHAQLMLQSEDDEEIIVECIDELEELSDRAMQVCRQSGDRLDSNLQNAVKSAHQKLSDLKHQLH